MMTRTELQQLLPHRDAALWLDGIDGHDANSIRGYCQPDCVQHLHVAQTGWLFEAAAQLCAVHGALYANDETIMSAHIGKLSAMQVHHPLNTSGAILLLQASLLGGGSASALYTFTVRQQEQLLLDGQLLVVLQHA